MACDRLSARNIALTYAPEEKHTYLGEYWSYRRMIALKDCPHLHTPERLQERRNIEKRHGKYSPFVRSMVYGEFQRSGEFNLIFDDRDMRAVRKAMSGANEPIFGDKRTAMDISQGGDRQILVFRDGTDVLLIDEYQQEDELAQAEYWVALHQKLGVAAWQSAVDGGGAGATVIRYMEKKLGFRGLYKYMGNQSPMNPTEFYDRYTEDHWKLKSLLHLGCLRLPFCQRLIEQMENRRFVEMEHRRIKCEPKAAMRRRKEDSPDELDALVMCIRDINVETLAVFTGLDQKNEKKQQEEKTIGMGSSPFAGMRTQPNMSDLIGTNSFS